MGSGVRSCRASFQSGCRAGRSCVFSRRRLAQARAPSAKPVDPDRPFVLAVAAAGGPRIAALNEAAEAAGLARRRAAGRRAGESRIFAGARRRCRRRRCRAAPPDLMGDALHADRLALATRTTAPTVFSSTSKAPPICSAARKADRRSCRAAANNFGLPARLAVADTPGAAWALSRFHARAIAASCPRAEEAAALAPLPIEALAAVAGNPHALRRLGFKTVGALLDKPRAPFAARFPAELLRRLDQALGRIDEPLVPIVAPPVYHSLRYLLEPIVTAGGGRRPRQPPDAERWCMCSTRDDVGARALAAFASIASTARSRRIDIALTLPTRSVAHVARLIALKLEALAAMRGCRLRLRGDRPCRHPRRTDAGAADRT